MTNLQKEALLRMARDLSRGDPLIIAAVQAAIENPPRTTEEVGFYVSGDESDFENCFRKLCGLLDDSPWGSSAEDKYVREIFAEWVGPGRLAALPEEVERAFPDPGDEVDAGRAKRHFGAATRAVENAFHRAGAPLLSLDTGGGDTLIFVNVEPTVADRWRDVELGKTYDGDTLAVRSPMWSEFWEHLSSFSDDDLGELPEGVPGPRPLRSLETVVK
jgi:hypothetical protein